jgi:hypothetical protein
MRLRALKAAEQLDSLSYQIALRDQKLQIISDILSGKPPSFSDTSQQVAEPVNPAAFHRSLEDSLLRQSVEEEDKFSVIPGRKHLLLQYIRILPVSVFFPCSWYCNKFV